MTLVALAYLPEPVETWPQGEPPEAGSETMKWWSEASVAGGCVPGRVHVYEEDEGILVGVCERCGNVMTRKRQRPRKR